MNGSHVKDELHWKFWSHSAQPFLGLSLVCAGDEGEGLVAGTLAISHVLFQFWNRHIR